MTTKTDDQERRDFEAAYTNAFPMAASRADKFGLEDWGDYVDASVGIGWRMWQAGRAAVQAGRQHREEPFDTPATVPENSQNWAELNGVTAWQLIVRHADNWADIERMMGEFVAAKIEADREHIADVRKMVPSDDEIIELRTAYDWRLPQGNIRFARALLSRYGSSQPALERAAREVLDTELADLACTGSDAPAEHALGMLQDALNGQPAASVEVDAWRERFPAYEYRPQDECVSLKLSAPAASAEPVIYIWFAQSGTDLDHIQYWTRDPAQAARQEARFDRPPMRLSATAAPVAQEPPVPDDVWESLQRLIENGAALGPASREDARVVARYRDRQKFMRVASVAQEPVASDWVACPVCGEPDMRRTVDADGNALISCVNHACRSNGGSATQAAQELALVGWTVGMDGGGILHAAKYTEDEAKRAGYPLAVYRLARQKSAPVAAPVAQEPVGCVVSSPVFGNADRKIAVLEVDLPVDTPLFAAPVAAQAQPVPDVLFDGYAVLSALDDKARSRTSPENVSDVLDAVVRLMRAIPQTVAQAQLSGNSGELASAQDREDAVALTAEFSKGYELGLSQRTSRDREDAQRYRWLRDLNGVDGSGVEIFINDEAHGPGHLTAQIDAARAAKGE